MLNGDFIQQNVPLYQEALWLTVRLAFWGILGATGLGLLISVIKLYKIPVLSQLSQVYIELSRNTPLLIQLYFLYFGLPKIGLILNPETCAVAGLIFLGGSYMAETFRSGLEAVTRTQIELGLSIGLTFAQNFRYVIFPQALAVALPSFTANVIFLIKETSVFSVVALADLMYVAKDLIGLYYETDEALLMLVIAYLIVLLPISLVFAWLERRLRHEGFGSKRSLSGK
ncbi:amino acid ABC transporter permease [Streptococcus dentiloxodontae]